MKSTFFCVQPITINTKDLIDINNIDVNYSSLQGFTDNLPLWIKEIRKKNNSIYEDFFSIKLPKVSIFKLKSSMPSNISDLLDTNLTNFYLLYDLKLSSFNLCFEIVLDYSSLTEDEILEILSDNEHNIYSSIKSLIVRENEKSILASWTRIIYQNTFSAVQKILNKVYKLDINFLESLSILPSSGNITNFIDNTDSQFSSSIYNKFLDINYFVDSLDIDNPKPLLLGSDLYYFGGDFHTIIISKERNLLSYYPIQFQMNFNKNYIFIISKIYTYINKIIINTDEDSQLSFKNKQKIMKNLINKIVLFEMKNDIFKFTIDNNKERIYDFIELKWNIETSIKTLESYIKKYEDFIKEEHHNLIELEKAIAIKKQEELLNRIETLDKERRLLEENGFKDQLTRAYNRKKLYVDIEEYTLNNTNPYYLSFIDGDKFKSINDTYGHQAGDEVLKRMVDIMFQVLSDEEVNGGVYRFGGEEFILIIFDEKKSSVIGILNEIKDAIENTVVEHKEDKIKFTISVGSSKLQENQSLQELIEIADQLVYKAKENGRNRIESIF